MTTASTLGRRQCAPNYLTMILYERHNDGLTAAQFLRPANERLASR